MNEHNDKDIVVSRKNKLSRINNYDFFKDCLENDVRKGVTLFNLTPEQIQSALRDVAEHVIDVAGDVPLD